MYFDSLTYSCQYNKMLYDCLIISEILTCYDVLLFVFIDNYPYCLVHFLVISFLLWFHFCFCIPPMFRYAGGNVFYSCLTFLLCMYVILFFFLYIFVCFIVIKIIITQCRLMYFYFWHFYLLCLFVFFTHCCNGILI